jgi:hypothetical protein
LYPAVCQVAVLVERLLYRGSQALDFGMQRQNVGLRVTEGIHDCRLAAAPLFDCSF